MAQQHTIIDIEHQSEEAPVLSPIRPRESTPEPDRRLEPTAADVKKSSTIRLGAFDGNNMPLETHLAKLRNCAAYYGWSAADRVCHLKASLEGAAATLLWQLPEPCSEERLLELLKARFGTADMVERFRCELRQRRRRPGETMQTLYNDVSRLIALSYPGHTGELAAATPSWIASATRK